MTDEPTGTPPTPSTSPHDERKGRERGRLRDREGIMEHPEALGHPYYAEDTADDANAVTPGYVSYARPIGPGHAQSGPILRGMAVTALGVLLLSWIPFLGPFIAGFAGGWVARGWRGGLLASFIPGALASIVTWFYYEILRAVAPDFVLMTFNAASFWPWFMQGAIVFTILGGSLGGYLHSLRDHETRDSGRRVQIG